jgi:hypothetical protein
MPSNGSPPFASSPEAGRAPLTFTSSSTSSEWRFDSVTIFSGSASAIASIAFFTSAMFANSSARASTSTTGAAGILTEPPGSVTIGADCASSSADAVRDAESARIAAMHA